MQELLQQITRDQAHRNHPIPVSPNADSQEEKISKEAVRTKNELIKIKTERIAFHQLEIQKLEAKTGSTRIETLKKLRELKLMVNDLKTEIQVLKESTETQLVSRQAAKLTERNVSEQGMVARY